MAALGKFHLQGDRVCLAVAAALEHFRVAELGTDGFLASRDAKGDGRQRSVGQSRSLDRTSLVAKEGSGFQERVLPVEVDVTQDAFVATTEAWLELCALLHEVSHIVLQHTFAALEVSVDSLEALVHIMNQAARVACLVCFGTFAHEILHFRVAKSLVENHPTKALQIVLYHGSYYKFLRNSGMFFMVFVTLWNIVGCVSVKVL